MRASSTSGQNALIDQSVRWMARAATHRIGHPDAEARRLLLLRIERELANGNRPVAVGVIQDRFRALCAALNS